MEISNHSKEISKTIIKDMAINRINMIIKVIIKMEIMAMEINSSLLIRDMDNKVDMDRINMDSKGFKILL